MKIKNRAKEPGKGILLPVLLLSLILSSCSLKKEAENDSYIKLVKTVNIQKLDPLSEKQFPGVIDEAEEINLAFRVGGPISRILIKEGQYVKKGQLIAEIDQRDYMIQKTAIQARVDQLREEYRRIEELNKRKTVADNDFEKMKAGKEMAEIQLKNANDQLNDTRLYAPYSGYITALLFEEGEMLNIGTPFARLIDVSLLKVEVDVPTSLYLVKDKISKIECVQEDIPGEKYPLTFYANNIKANSNGLFRFYFYHQPEPGSLLSPGMNVSVNISYSNGDSSLVSIPLNAIFSRGEESYVWVVEDNTVKARRVTTNDFLRDGNVGIIEGLKAGEEIVVGGLDHLHEDEEVRVLDKASKTNIGNLI